MNFQMFVMVSIYQNVSRTEETILMRLTKVFLTFG